MLAPLALLFTVVSGESAVVRADGFEIFLAAPKGWRIDALSKRGEGLPAVLVRPGEAFDTAKNVMFLNLDRREFPDLAAFVANRRRDFLKGRPRAEVRPVSGLTAGDGHPVLLFDFDDPSIPQYERRAYVLAQDGVATLFLQCATPQGRQAHAAALKALVESYRDLHAPHPR